jgi:hypothetical protein
MFQEVWDYKLTFEAWKASNLMGEGGKDLTPKLELTLMTEDEVFNSPDLAFSKIRGSKGNQES